MDEWCNEKRERMFVVELLTYLDDMCFAAMDCEKNASVRVLCMRRCFGINHVLVRLAEPLCSSCVVYYAGKRVANLRHSGRGTLAGAKSRTASKGHVIRL